MDNNDWSKFTRRIPVNADAQKIYDLWATPAGLQHWFLRNARFKSSSGDLRDANQHIQAGDTYEWSWHGYTDDVQERGTILEANGRDFFKFIFGKAGVVSVSLKKQGNQTVVEITQEQIPTDEKSKADYYVGCSVGWTFYLANLKSLLEGGIDLRNKEVNIRQVVSS
ncbi:MAG TPA: SRPBCC domain-containing protein [Chitinophagales bacterium]|nr:SRPBCC domain-containing protein [Chitinophagales bacterium]